MKVLQRKPVREEKKPQIPMWVPAWVKRELGFKRPGDEEWFIGEDDNGERFGGLRRRIPKKEGEGEEKTGEEDGENDRNH